MSSKLRNKLWNWRFETAKNYIEGQDEDVIKEVNNLSDTFGDSGWFGGVEAEKLDIRIDSLLNKIKI